MSNKEKDSSSTLNKQETPSKRDNDQSKTQKASKQNQKGKNNHSENSNERNELTSSSSNQQQSQAQRSDFKRNNDIIDQSEKNTYAQNQEKGNSPSPNNKESEDALQNAMQNQIDIQEMDLVKDIADKFTQSATSKLKEMEGKTKSQTKSEKEKYLSKFQKRKQMLEKFVQGSKFARLYDKICYVLGSYLVIFTVFLLGNYPHTYFYDFFCISTIILITIRFYAYIKKNWHFYLLDLCYPINFVFIYFLVYDPKNEYLFKIVYTFSAGILAFAIPSFKCSLVFHRLDNLITLYVHLFPLITVWNLKWRTLPYEQTLKPEERYFLELNDQDLSNFEQLKRLLLIPLLVYFLWAFIYYMTIFVVCEGLIKRNNYETMYAYVERNKWYWGVLDRVSKFQGRLVFAGIHLGSTFVNSLLAIFVYPTYFRTTTHLLVQLTLSLWFGAGYYMDYFAKKYEINLKKFDEIEAKLKEE